MSKIKNTNISTIPKFEPAKDGRGIWYILHIMSIQATTNSLKQDFIKYINWLALNYPCTKCKNHMQKFLKENPFDLYMYIYNGDKDIGMFKWCWSLHNSVNARLGKPIMEFNMAYSLFDPINIIPCSEDCADDDEEHYIQETYNEQKENPIIIKKFENIKKIENNDNMYNKNISTKIRLIPTKSNKRF